MVTQADPVWNLLGTVVAHECGTRRVLINFDAQEEAAIPETKFSQDQIDPLLALNQDQLYSLLVPPEAAAEMHHPGAMIALGKIAFVDLLRKTRQAVCHAYKANKDTVSNSVELVSTVASAMMGAAGLVKEAVLPAAVLVIKIGFDVVCKGVDDPHGTGA